MKSQFFIDEDGREILMMDEAYGLELIVERERETTTLPAFREVIDTMNWSEM